MKNLIESYKNFKYKKITAIVLLIISEILFRVTDILAFSYMSLIFFIYLLSYTSVYIYHGLKNHVKDSTKVEGIIVTILVYAFYAALAALVLFKVLLA